jgi:hypothetical protein
MSSEPCERQETRFTLGNFVVNTTYGDSYIGEILLCPGNKTNDQEFGLSCDAVSVSLSSRCVQNF